MQYIYIILAILLFVFLHHSMNTVFSTEADEPTVIIPPEQMEIDQMPIAANDDQYPIYPYYEKNYQNYFIQ